MNQITRLFFLFSVIAAAALAQQPSNPIPPINPLASYTAKGTNAADIFLRANGITNTIDRQTIIAANYDVQVTVASALRNRAWNVLGILSKHWQHPLTVTNNIAIGRMVMASSNNPPLVSFLCDWLQTIPVDQRQRFSPMLSNMPPVFVAMPTYSALFVKYQVLQGIALNSIQMPEQDLVANLLAPEPMMLQRANDVRAAIKNKAIVLAKAQLRSGAAPATTNGIPPASVLIGPVSAALNAPLCAGLEEALRALGGSITNVDRSALPALCAAWQQDALNAVSAGDLSTAQSRLGKISVVLGAQVFIPWNETFNKGN